MKVKSRVLTPGVYNLLLLPAALLFLYEVRPPMSSDYTVCIYEIRLIKEYVTAKCEPTQNTFKHKLCIHSITLCDITIQIVTYRVD